MPVVFETVPGHSFRVTVSGINPCGQAEWMSVLKARRYRPPLCRPAPTMLSLLMSRRRGAKPRPRRPKRPRGNP